MKTSGRVYCQQCGAANRVTAKFCMACGRALFSTTGPLATGQLLQDGRYRILSCVGQGGFGAVYKAEDTNLGSRVVALKEMRETWLSPQEQVNAASAFKREAILLANLKHRHLPHVYDHFTALSRWYLVMEFIQGGTLKGYLKKKGGKLPWQEVLAISIELCEVLSYLHSQEQPIIFRDLKPSNVMLTPRGEVFLIDFGIARLFKPGKTQDTERWGTPGYAAPEQSGSQQTSPQSDIYSFGAMLHEMLGGDDPSLKPFHFGPLPSAVPGSIVRLMRQMVSIEASDRPASMEVVKEQLVAWRSDSQKPAGEPPATDAEAEPPLPPEHRREQRLSLAGTTPEEEAITRGIEEVEEEIRRLVTAREEEAPEPFKTQMDTGQLKHHDEPIPRYSPMYPGTSSDQEPKHQQEAQRHEPQPIELLKGLVERGKEWDAKRAKMDAKQSLHYDDALPLYRLMYQPEAHPKERPNRDTAQTEFQAWPDTTASLPVRFYTDGKLEGRRDVTLSRVADEDILNDGVLLRDAAAKEYQEGVSSGQNPADVLSAA